MENNKKWYLKKLLILSAITMVIFAFGIVFERSGYIRGKNSPEVLNKAWDRYEEGYKHGKEYGVLFGRKEELTKFVAHLKEQREENTIICNNIFPNMEADSMLESRSEYPILTVESDGEYWKVTRRKEYPSLISNAFIFDQQAFPKTVGSMTLTDEMVTGTTATHDESLFLSVNQEYPERTETFLMNRKEYPWVTLERQDEYFAFRGYKKKPNFAPTKKVFEFGPEVDETK